MSDKLYIVIPAYNEADNIKNVLEDWYNYVRGGGYKLIIVDDGSTDDTFRIMQECAKNKPNFIPLTKPNGGHGSALLFGYRYAIEHGADYIFQTDSDGQTLPEEFSAFWDLRNDYDAVLGCRPNRQDGRARVFVEKVLCLILRIIFGVRVPDANAPFRLMKASLVAKYLPRMPQDFNLPNVMLTAYFARYHENITFKPITFRPRQGGTNSINLKKICRIGLKAVKDFMTIRRTMKNA